MAIEETLCDFLGQSVLAGELGELSGLLVVEFDPLGEREGFVLDRRGRGLARRLAGLARCFFARRLAEECPRGLLGWGLGWLLAIGGLGSRIGGRGRSRIGCRRGRSTPRLAA